MERTSDVFTSDPSEDKIGFDSFSLNEALVRGLHESGFISPSPVQAKSIPPAKAGLNLIVHAKSGTGKTAAFGVALLERFLGKVGSSTGIFGVVLEPTREIALQTKSVIENVGKHVPGLHVHAAIGGVDPAFDYSLVATCNVLTATPGRLKALLSEGALDFTSTDMFILDEADELLSDRFEKDVSPIIEQIPRGRQILCFSASYPPHIHRKVERIAPNAEEIRVTPMKHTLIGVMEYFWELEEEDARRSSVLKTKKLTELLSMLDYEQCVVFCNSFATAKRISGLLMNRGLPTLLIYGRMKQSQRISALQSFRDFSSRILVSTDLTARGIDLSRVNLIINVDLSGAPDTHLHRSGRTGRFGTHGVVISLVTKQEVGALGDFAKYYKCEILELPENANSMKDLLSLQRESYQGRILGYDRDEKREQEEVVEYESMNEKFKRKLTELKESSELTKRRKQSPLEGGQSTPTNAHSLIPKNSGRKSSTSCESCGAIVCPFCKGYVSLPRL